MSILKKAFKGAIWLSSFRAAAQLFSWATTIVIAHILVPRDYGLMGMATVLTGFAALFSDLGLGAAIIQRKEVSQKELSSLFWFLVLWGILLGLICFVLAYPTVAIFKERRLLRITQSVSLLYIIGSFTIVPFNILNRSLRFKAIGFIEATSVIVSCLAMISIAKAGGGVWTLIGGHVIRQLVRLGLVFLTVHWRPSLLFNLAMIRPYVSFGLNVAGSRVLNYLYNRSPIFFGGRALGDHLLGFYCLASDLALIPRDKIISLINRIAFPVFSRYQDDQLEFNWFYLRVTKLIAMITFPIFFGVFFTADLLIPVVLGEKWRPTVFMFKMLCVNQLIFCLTIPNNLANNAQNRPHWTLYRDLISAILLPYCFYVAARHGLNALVIPWVTVDPLIRLGFTLITIRKMGISAFEYAKNLLHPFLATVSMCFVLWLIRHMSACTIHSSGLILSLTILSSAVTYLAYMVAFQRHVLAYLWNMSKA